MNVYCGVGEGRLGGLVGEQRRRAWVDYFLPFHSGKGESPEIKITDSLLKIIERLPKFTKDYKL